MFDIYEYYAESAASFSSHETTGIEESINYDIEELLRSRFQKLYLTDRYKHGSKSIEIAYPALDYPGKRPFFLTPDKLRFYLSSYPNKNAFHFIERIVIRPRYIELNDVELAALYLKGSRTLALYMTDPSYMQTSIDTSLTKDFISVELPALTSAGFHPVWHYISVISQNKDGSGIEKFFFKQNKPNGINRQILADMSYFYSRHGY